MTKEKPERLIILFNKNVYPPVGGITLRVSSFTEIYASLVRVAESGIEEVIVAGPYHDVISTASLFSKTDTVVVGLLTEDEWYSLDEFGGGLVDVAYETTLLYLMRFPPDMSKKIALARRYKMRCIDLIEKMQYDSDLLYSLFGIPPQVVLLISQNRSNPKSQFLSSRR